MMNDYDTPKSLEPSAEGVNEWVRYHLTRIHNRARTIEEKLEEVCTKQDKFDEFMMKTEVRLTEGVSTFKYMEGKLTTIDEQIKELKSIRSNPGHNGKPITFQWALEKLALPVIMLIIGIIFTLLFK